MCTLSGPELLCGFSPFSLSLTLDVDIIQYIIFLKICFRFWASNSRVTCENVSGSNLVITGLKNSLKVYANSVLSVICSQFLLWRYSTKASVFTKFLMWLWKRFGFFLRLSVSSTS